MGENEPVCGWCERTMTLVDSQRGEWVCSDPTCEANDRDYVPLSGDCEDFHSDG